MREVKYLSWDLSQKR